MAKNQSAGVLLYRRHKGELEVFLVHPGGPYWRGKDNGAWTLPKGKISEGETPFEAAKREFHEETGSEAKGHFQELTPLKQPSGKIIHVWAVEGEIDPATLKSNTIEMEWPPRSGIQREFPEIDDGRWYPVQAAYEKLLPGQRGFLDQLKRLLGLDNATSQS